MGCGGPGNGNILGLSANLGPLQSNGGPTMTMLLRPVAPAINAGDPKFAPPPTADQSGFPRVVKRLDMGAVETGPRVFRVPPPRVPISDSHRGFRPSQEDKGRHPRNEAPAP